MLNDLPDVIYLVKWRCSDLHPGNVALGAHHFILPHILFLPFSSSPRRPRILEPLWPVLTQKALRQCHPLPRPHTHGHPEAFLRRGHLIACCWSCTHEECCPQGGRPLSCCCLPDFLFISGQTQAGNRWHTQIG